MEAEKVIDDLETNNDREPVEPTIKALLIDITPSCCHYALDLIGTIFEVGFLISKRILDWALELSQKLIIFGLILGVALVMWALVFGSEENRYRVFEAISKFEDGWKILVILMVFVFRHDISTMMARIKIFNKDGVQFTEKKYEPYVLSRLAPIKPFKVEAKAKGEEEDAEPTNKT
jgi:hypothetical protein